MKRILLIGLLGLMPGLLTAQQWEWMDGPYFVYSVTGMSVGYTDYGQPNQQMHAYAVGSDLEHEYVYSYQGDSPVGNWQRNPNFIDGIKHVSASRYNGTRGYAAVPEGTVGIPGVRVTIDGGVTWPRTISQPGNLLFTGIETHPSNGNICYTASEQNSPAFSVWRTADGGIIWNSLNSGIPDPTIRANSIRVDPNSGNNINTTRVYACFNNYGIRKSVDGGSNWTGLSLPGYGTSYNGIDIAAKEGDSNNLYALSQHNGVYELWHSTDGGNNWESPAEKDFGTNTMFKVLVEDYDYEGEHQNAVWVIGDNYVYTHVVGQYPGWTDFPIGYTPRMSGFVDPTARDSNGEIIPGGLLYLGSKLTIQLGYYEVGDGIHFHDKEITSGTQIANVVSLDCAQSIAGLYDVDRPALRVMTDLGGFVYKNRNITWEGDPDEWITETALQSLTINTAHGKEISVYYGLSDGTYIDSYVAAGHDGYAPLLLDSGFVVDWGSTNPASFGAVTGPHYVLAGWGQAFVGGQDNSYENVTWIVNQVSPPIYRQLSEILDISTNSPVINDITLERINPGYYYFCGTRTSDLENAVAYVYALSDDPTYFNGGLGNPYQVRNANSITKSKEIEEGPELLILYLGTEKGIFKNRFNPGNPPDWYPATYGIGSNIEIGRLVNYYHVIENWDAVSYGEQKPDSIIQYALGHDASWDPYLYVSPDSGRSWIEFGGYFRDRRIAVNDIVTFTDIRESFPTRAHLGVGTDNGVYRMKYNVKSGTLASNETWGPGLVIVNGDVIVPFGKTLTIQPGTEIKFVYFFDRTSSGASFSKAELIVAGTLNAAGNFGNPVEFVSSKSSALTAGDWYGIRALTGSNVSLDYCEIRNAVYGVWAYQPAQLNVRNCLIENNLTAGVYASFMPPGTTIENTRIQSSGTYGIYCSEGSFAASADTIDDCRYAIYYAGGDALQILNCLVTYPAETPLSSYYGISVKKSSAVSPLPTISGDSISGFDQGGIYFEGVTNTSARIEATSVYNSGMSGIYFMHSSAEINGGSTSTRNLLKSNDYGLLLYSSSSPKVRRTKFENAKYTGASINSGCFPDLGNEISHGDNSFIKNDPMGPSYKHLNNSNLTPVNAIYNYWQPFSSALIVNAIYEPHLTSDPLPKVRPEWDLTGQADDFELARAYPNPFNSATTISFNLTSPRFGIVKIYNIMGQEVNTIFEGYGSSGENTVVWNGENRWGTPVSTGVYLAQMKSRDSQRTIKMTFLR